ncbi:hypothetical protein PG987_015821 [Apiospora arundinis]
MTASNTTTRSMERSSATPTTSARPHAAAAHQDSGEAVGLRVELPESEGGVSAYQGRFVTVSLCGLFEEFVKARRPRHCGINNGNVAGFVCCLLMPRASGLGGQVCHVAQVLMESTSVRDIQLIELLPPRYREDPTALTIPVLLSRGSATMQSSIVT